MSSAEKGAICALYNRGESWFFVQMGGATLTDRLQSLLAGDAAVDDDLIREILPRLREIALRALHRERYSAPLSQTELIHELWIGSLAKCGWQIRDRGHFYALVCLAMRRILVDFARRRVALRRGGNSPPVSLSGSADHQGGRFDDAEQIVVIGLLMEQLERKDPEAALIVDMHYFSGFTLREIAGELGLSLKQVRLRWERGLKWLKNMLLAKPVAGSHSGMPRSAL